MKLRQLGNTDLMITPITFGGWEIGGFPFFSNIQENEAVKAVKSAYEAGINIIDTAPIYGFGHSEKLIGKAVKNFRNKIVITTKCGLRWHEEKMSAIFKNASEESILQEIDLSLKRLQTDYIDLYLLHWYDTDTKAPISETDVPQCYQIGGIFKRSWREPYQALTAT